MKYQATNAYYFAYLNKIGGIESHLYYIAQKYGKYDIAIFYKTGDPTQVTRLKKYVRTIKLEFGDTIECKNMFCCFNRDVLDVTKAETKYLVLHGDYKAMLESGQMTRKYLPLDDRIDKYIGVSQTICDSWEEITGIKAENVYEPVVLLKKQKTLMFLSATRLSKEKGWDRMVKLAEELDRNNVNYLWYIFTDQKKPGTPNMIFCEPRLDIANKMGGFDAYIQLSDNEGFCLSAVEALIRKVPVICTDLPVLKELGLNETNSIKLSFDMDNIPINKIRNVDKMKFNYEPPEDRWDTVLDHTKSDYKLETITVQATDQYEKLHILDKERQEYVKAGTIWDITGERYQELLDFEKRSKVKLINRI